MIRTTLRKPNGTVIQEDADLSELWQSLPGSVCWMDIINEPAEREYDILTELHCHPLAIQDIQRSGHPPKFEEFDNNFFLLYRGLENVAPGLVLQQIPIALFISDYLIITRHKGTSFAVNQWWENPELEHILATPFVLATKIVHTSFGRYLDALTEFEAELTEKEETMQDTPDDDDMRELTAYKARLRKLRRTFNYHERMAAGLLAVVQEDGTGQYNAYIHDAQNLHDRADRINGLLTMYYEICGDLIEGYLSITSHQLNRTMQFLTIITTIFVPLGFLAGIYGMNFENMPELGFRYGYFILLGVMASIGTGALIAFKLKRWL